MRSYFTLFLALCSYSFTARSEPDFRTKLLFATYTYIDAINRMCDNRITDPETLLKTICAQDCKKIFNGKISAHNRGEFIYELQSMKQQKGEWSAVLTDTFIDTQNSAAIVCLNITIAGAQFRTQVILRYNSMLKIHQVNEVSGVYEGDE
jgi:hypothetical protein